MHQSAVSRILFVEIPSIATAEVDAALTECALKILGSMPASRVTSFSHRAIVEEVTGWCALMNDMNNCEGSLRRGCVTPHSALEMIPGRVLYSLKP